MTGAGDRLTAIPRLWSTVTAVLTEIKNFFTLKLLLLALTFVPCPRPRGEVPPKSRMVDGCHSLQHSLLNILLPRKLVTAC